MKLPNGTEMQHLPDGVLIAGYKLDFESLCELTLQMLVTNPLRTDDPRIQVVDVIKQAVLVNDGAGHRFLKLDLLQPLPSSKGHEA
jgi:hypothetical protein